MWSLFWNFFLLIFSRFFLKFLFRWMCVIELTSWNELQHKTPSHTNKTVNEPAMISATSTCSSENDSQIENTQPAPRCKSSKKSPTKRRQSSKKRVIRREATASSDEQDQLNNKHCLPRLFSPCGTPLTPPSFYSKNKPQFFLNGHQCLRDEDVAATLLFELAKNSPDALTPFDRDSFVLVLWFKSTPNSRPAILIIYIFTNYNFEQFSLI